MKRNYFVIIIIFLFLLSCAKQGFPPGGPVDRIPPKIVRTIPLPGATFVDPRTSVKVWFSEGVIPASAKDAVFITPYPGQGVKYKWRGKRLEIVFPRPLKKNCTYVITFGTGIKDYRNNSMESSFILAFSTGPVLDKGEISGRVYGIKDAKGIDIWAYQINDHTDPDPSTKEPDYIVQCEANGGFLFSHISSGLYRLFAVRDRAADRIYQPGEDEIGVAFRDVLLSRKSSLHSDNLYFKVMKEDTTLPGLVRVVPVDYNHLTLQFDKPLSSQQIFSPDSILIISTVDTLDTLGVEQFYLDPINSKIAYVITYRQKKGEKYKLKVKTLFDEAGNSIDKNYSRAFFNGSEKADTTSPELVKIVPEPGTKSANLRGVVHLIFNEAMNQIKFPDGFFLKSDSGKLLSGSFQWRTPAEVLFLSRKKLKSSSTYTVEIFGKNVMDLVGNPVADTSFQFRTLNKDTLSEISGTVFDRDSNAVGQIFVTAKQIKNPGLLYTQILPVPGRYQFTNVLPGSYTIEAFRDRDGNGKYSFGKPFPYKPSERFVVLEDTVKVKPRWPNEGNDLILP